jgi:hypothetical protein
MPYDGAMKPRVYLETTIPSYLTARPKNDLLRTAWQQVTRDWWDFRRHDFELFVSEAMIDECRAGDPAAAAARLVAIQNIEVLRETPEALSLAKALIASLKLPARAEIDALHIALSAVHKVDYLLTWNCTHIANAAFTTRIVATCSKAGYRVPIICTPQQLMKGEVENG